MALSASARLTAIDDAIDALIDGRVQQYTINGQVYTRLSLKDLRELRREVAAEAARATRSRFSVGVFRSST